MQCRNERITPYLCIHAQPFSPLKKLFGRMTASPVEYGLGEYWRILDRIKTFDLSAMTDSQLAERAGQIARLVRESVADIRMGDRDGQSKERWDSLRDLECCAAVYGSSLRIHGPALHPDAAPEPAPQTKS